MARTLVAAIWSSTRPVHRSSVAAVVAVAAVSVVVVADTVAVVMVAAVVAEAVAGIVVVIAAAVIAATAATAGKRGRSFSVASQISAGGAFHTPEFHRGDSFVRIPLRSSRNTFNYLASRVVH